MNVENILETANGIILLSDNRKALMQIEYIIIFATIPGILEIK